MVYITKYFYKNACDLMYFRSFLPYQRKEAQEANARYNEMRYCGLVDNEDE